MTRLVLKVVLTISLLMGLAVLLVGFQLYLVQEVASGQSRNERFLIPAVVPWLESTLGREAMRDPQTVNTAWIAGGILAGIGFLGLLGLGLQDSARERQAALLVTPPTFDDSEMVSSHEFVPEGLEGRASMIRFFSYPILLMAALGPVGIYATVTHGHWEVALLLLGATLVCVAFGVFLYKGDQNRFLKSGVERIDIMTGGLRWFRHNDPTERTVAWSEVYACESYDHQGHPWNHFSMVVLRTGEKIRLAKCCLSDYATCVDLVKQGLADGSLG